MDIEDLLKSHKAFEGTAISSVVRDKDDPSKFTVSYKNVPAPDDIQITINDGLAQVNQVFPDTLVGRIDYGTGSSYSTGAVGVGNSYADANTVYEQGKRIRELEKHIEQITTDLGNLKRFKKQVEEFIKDSYLFD